MDTQLATTEDLRGTDDGLRRSSRVGRLVLSSIGLLTYSALLWLLAFAVVPMVFGWTPTIIGSGSMDPVIREGDVVLSSPTDGEGLGVGTVVFFDSPGARTPVMHRIVGVNQDGTYQTKGDANAAADSTPVHPHEVHGVARLLVPYAGLPAHWVRTGNWPGVASFALVIVLSVWLAHGRPRSDRDRPGPGRRRSRRWAVVSGITVVLLAATGATAMAAFTGSTAAAGNSFAAGTWAGSVTVVDVAAGEGHGCAVIDTGSVYCWGENGKGQLGDGTNTDRTAATPVVAPAGPGFLVGAVAITAGREHSCALISTGSVYCWGEGSQGQLGNGAATDSATPVQVDAVGGGGELTGVLQVDAGGEHSCARLAGGTAACWGDNGRGQLGDGTTVDRADPVLVLKSAGKGNLAGVASLGLGDLHGCVAITDGSAYCWGAGSGNRLGNGSTGDQHRPARVRGAGGSGWLAGVTAIDGGGQHTCATVGGSAYCWGLGDHGEVGDGATVARAYPTQVLGRGGTGLLGDVGAVSLGADHTCALHGDGTVSCWGRNDSGQLGDGTTTNHSVPVRAGTFTDAAGVSAGWWHTAALRGTSAWGWGGNTFGQLGDGTTTDRLVPVQVSGL